MSRPLFPGPSSRCTFRPPCHPEHCMHADEPHVYTVLCVICSLLDPSLACLRSLISERKNQGETPRGPSEQSQRRFKASFGPFEQKVLKEAKTPPQIKLRLLTVPAVRMSLRGCLRLFYPGREEEKSAEKSLKPPCPDEQKQQKCLFSTI